MVSTKFRFHQAKSSFQQLYYDPTKEHIKKVEQWSDKWIRINGISKEWKEYIVNYDTQPAKNSTLYKTNKSDILVRLLTTGRNPAIENLSRLIENICAPLASNLPNILKDTSHFLDLINDIKKNSLPDILVLFDIINMFPCTMKEEWK